MKSTLVLLSVAFALFNTATAQVICIYCYDQNDSISYNVTNLLLNGGFEDTNCPPSTGVIGSPTSFCPNSNGYVCDFANWTCTGGGSDTYACLYNDSINKSLIIEGTNAVYFGNYYCNPCSNNGSDTSCFINLGCSVTGFPTGYPKNTPQYGGKTGVSLQQTVSGLTIGNTYVLEFWAGGEESYSVKGIFALDVGFGDTMLRCTATGWAGGIGTRYIVEFNATATSHTIKFTNWGHFGASTELVLDDVKLYTLSQLNPIVPSCGGVQSSSMFNASDTTICQKFCTDFFDLSTNNPTSWEWLFPGGTPASSTDQNPANICYNNPGTYDVTLITTSVAGNDTITLSNYITVYTTPAFPTITVTGNVLSSSYAPAYQWQFNSVDIPGATNQDYTATQTGYYTVIISDENGCVSSTTIYFEVTGIDGTTNGNQISVHPNPSNGTFIIESLDGFKGGNISIEVMNAVGQKVFFTAENISGINWKKEIELSDISDDIYYLEIKSENISLKKKIIISK